MAVAALIGRLRGLSLPTSDPICAGVKQGEEDLAIVLSSSSSNDLIERHGERDVSSSAYPRLPFPLRTTGLQVSRTRSRGPGLTRLDQEMEDRY